MRAISDETEWPVAKGSEGAGGVGVAGVFDLEREAESYGVAYQGFGGALWGSGYRFSWCGAAGCLSQGRLKLT